VAIVAGILVGAACTYLLDPRQGNRRRAVAKDRLLHLVRSSAGRVGKGVRDLRNRVTGALAVATHSLQPQSSVSDHKLLERIRSTVGRSIAHPGAVDFAVHDGTVTLRGYLKPHEAGELIATLERVPGLRGINNQIVDAAESTSQMQ
jgi:hypothetical protein